MDGTITISIVIPLYNKEDSIEACLASIANQTYKDYEVIIVNDGSNDRSMEIIEDLPCQNLKLISQFNAGVSAARNRGIKEASGKYIAFLDADDTWQSDYLQVQYDLTLKYPGCSVYATNYEFNYNGRITPTILNYIPFICNDGILTNYFEVASYSHPPLWTSAVMVDANIIKKVGGFPMGIKSGEDLLTWAKMYLEGDIAFTRKIGAVYNLGAGYDFANLPPRRQDSGDPVGTGLKELYKYNHGIVGFRKYISHWHKMRASVAIRYGEKMETIVESCKSLYYNPLNYKAIPFIILSFIPAAIRKRIIVKFKG